MSNFINITKGELMKAFKSKTIIIFIAIAVLITILMSLIYGVTVEEYKKMQQGQLQDSEIDELLPEELINIIDAEIRKNDLEYAEGKSKYKHDTLDYQLRSQKIMFQYMIDHNLKPSDIHLFLSQEMVTSATMQNLIFFCLSIGLTIIGIYATILAAGSINDEINNGTMRLLLICPVNRIKLIVSKLLAIIIQLLIVLIIIILIAFMMGSFMLPKTFSDVMIVINANHVCVVPFGVALLIYSLCIILFGTMMAIFVLTLALLFRNKIFGIIVGVALSTNIITTILIYSEKIIKFFQYTVITNMQFLGYFTISGNPVGQLSLSGAILVYIINGIILLTISSLLFYRRDIN